MGVILNYCEDCEHLWLTIGNFPICNKFATATSLGIRDEKLRKRCYTPVKKEKEGSHGKN